MLSCMGLKGIVVIGRFRNSKIFPKNLLLVLHQPQKNDREIIRDLNISGLTLKVTEKWSKQ